MMPHFLNTWVGFAVFEVDKPSIIPLMTYANFFQSVERKKKRKSDNLLPELLLVPIRKWTYASFLEMGGNFIVLEMQIIFRLEGKQINR
ncbi:hypothetical protein TNCT_160521 [Trichonephila clavata]|uniref:Uncharacterized protein n=1 Tax=Trichonephila clavata TaxID=2740835 RepID=A0A8X6IID7_TRICU|nr:hypothetical protein TNCT_160521 [Trichonephila clavata]